MLLYSEPNIKKLSAGTISIEGGLGTSAGFGSRWEVEIWTAGPLMWEPRIKFYKHSESKAHSDESPKLGSCIYWPDLLCSWGPTELLLAEERFLETSTWLLRFFFGFVLFFSLH